MKLYIWFGVFCAYNCGIGYALAENEDQARDLIARSYAGTTLCGELNKEAYDQAMEWLGGPADTVTDQPFGGYEWGSS